MIRALVAMSAALVALTASSALARPHVRPRPGPVARPAPPLPSLPTIARVRVEAARDHVLVVHDVTLARGEWVSGDLDLYVAFGAPGVPRAFDARLLALGVHDTQARLDDPGEPIATERAPRRPVSAQVLVGRAQMAGAILHVKDAAFSRATSLSDVAVIRVRSLLDLPSEDAEGARDLVIRLGVAQGPPLAVDRIEVASTDPAPFVTRAEAQLCGPEADAYPLAIAMSPRPAPSRPTERAPIAPVLSVRHATDDLCIRFFTR